jgi:hypothetical protein
MKSDFYNYAINQLQECFYNKHSTLTQQEIVIRRLLRESISKDSELVPRFNEMLRVIKYQQENA